MNQLKGRAMTPRTSWFRGMNTRRSKNFVAHHKAASVTVRSGYVAISRASHEATLFTDDAAKLARQLGADVSKTSALEIGQASSVGQRIGLGL